MREKKVWMNLSYLLLKIKQTRIKTIIMIQKQGLISKFLIGSYPIFPNAIVRAFFSQSYTSIKKDFIFSNVKKFSTVFIIYKFYLLFNKL
jgi:hypothetical protein